MIPTHDEPEAAAELLRGLQQVAESAAELAQTLAFTRAASAATGVSGREATVDGKSVNTVTCEFGTWQQAMVFAAVVRGMMAPPPAEPVKAIAAIPSCN